MSLHECTKKNKGIAMNITEDQIKRAEKRLKRWRKERRRARGNTIIYDDDFKILLVQYMEVTGMSVNEAATEFNLYYSLVDSWRKKYGKYRSCYLHGGRKMNDVRTRCRAVKEYLEDGKSLEYLADKYGVKSPVSIAQWVDKYSKSYVYFMEVMPDGVPFVSNQPTYAPYNKDGEEVCHDSIRGDQRS